MLPYQRVPKTTAALWVASADKDLKLQLIHRRLQTQPSQKIVVPIFGGQHQTDYINSSCHHSKLAKYYTAIDLSLSLSVHTLVSELHLKYAKNYTHMHLYVYRDFYVPIVYLSVYIYSWGANHKYITCIYKYIRIISQSHPNPSIWSNHNISIKPNIHK